MAVIDSIYSNYLSNYGKNNLSRYDAHKRSELRSVYNSMLKLNKESPLYKLIDNNELRNYALDIKKSARDLKNVIASLSDYDSSLESAFQKNVASSSDESIASASYIGMSGNAHSNGTPSIDLEVWHLAKPQVNLGNFLDERSLSLAPGDYSFDLKTNASSYEFQYTIREQDTNGTVLDKISNLVNKSGVGLTAEVIHDDSNRVALQISSRQTGLAAGETSLFEIRPSANSDSIQSMDVLGINKTATNAANSAFLLNGRQKSSLSNTFTVNNAFEVTLNGVSAKHDPIQIGFKSNLDAIEDNVQQLLDAYNQFIKVGDEYSKGNQSVQLLSDLKRTAASYKNELESNGFIFQKDGTISLDRNVLETAMEEDGATQVFSTLSSFKDALGQKADAISLNPMQYVNKIMVEYKNPGRTFSAPYISSIYSGMFLDRFC